MACIRYPHRTYRAVPAVKSALRHPCFQYVYVAVRNLPVDMRVSLSFNIFSPGLKHAPVLYWRYSLKCTDAILSCKNYLGHTARQNGPHSVTAVDLQFGGDTRAASLMHHARVDSILSHRILRIGSIPYLMEVIRSIVTEFVRPRRTTLVLVTLHCV